MVLSTEILEHPYTRLPGLSCGMLCLFRSVIELSDFGDTKHHVHPWALDSLTGFYYEEGELPLGP